MQARMLGVVAIAWAIAGCATANGPERVASAESHECKVVAVYSASDVLHNQNARGVTGTDLQKAEGSADIGRVAGFPPASLRAPAKLDSVPSRLSRDC